MRHNSPSIGVRMRALRNIEKAGGFMPSPGRECTGSDLGARLGIAALYAGGGDDASANAAALLAIAGVADSERSRAAVLAAIDDVRRCVQASIDWQGAH